MAAMTGLSHLVTKLSSVCSVTPIAWRVFHVTEIDSNYIQKGNDYLLPDINVYIMLSFSRNDIISDVQCGGYRGFQLQLYSSGCNPEKRIRGCTYFIRNARAGREMMV